MSDIYRNLIRSITENANLANGYGKSIKIYLYKIRKKHYVVFHLIPLT